MESKELTVRQDRIVSQYGQSTEVATMAERILYMLPGVKKIGKHAAYALAQVAVSMGLNPFIGEIWAIPGKGGFSISGGIKAYRRAARNEMKRQDGCYDLQFRLPTKDEVEGVDLQPGWLVRVCKLTLFSRRALKFADYTKRLPTYTGIGIFRGSLEHTQMQPLQCVRKRAEADALKQAFDLPLAFADYTDPQNGHDPYVSRTENAIPDAAQGGNEPLGIQDTEMVPPDEFDDEYEDGVYLDQEPTTTVTPPTTPAENSSVENGGEKATTAVQKPVKQASAKSANSWSGDTITAIVEAKYAKNGHNAVKMLALSQIITPLDDKDRLVKWAFLYRRARSEEDSSPETAAKMADMQFLDLEAAADGGNMESAPEVPGA